MAFSSRNLAERMEELRFPLRSPNEEHPYSPVRGQNSFFTSHQQSAKDDRASLQRRFTADAGKLSGGCGFGQQGSHLPRPNESASRVRLCQVLDSGANMSALRIYVAEADSVGMLGDAST